MRSLITPIATLIVSAAAVAQNAPAAAAPCPIQFVKVNPLASNTKYVYIPVLGMEWLNISDRAITGIRFRVTFTSATGELIPRDNDIEYSLLHPQKVNSKSHAAWTLYDGEGYMRNKLYIWPVKILFADGTTWENSGDKCGTDTFAFKKEGKSWWTR